MEQSITDNQKNLGAFIHASTFLKYFFPLANFFAPLLLWTLHKEKRFLDHHGREALNFQLSIFIYALGIALLSLPFIAIFATDFISLVETIDRATDNHTMRHISNLGGYIALFAIFGLLLFGLFLFELYYVIMGTISASKGEQFKYPLSIKFITASETEQFENEPQDETFEENNSDSNISEEKISEEEKTQAYNNTSSSVDDIIDDSTTSKNS
ncbi:hypothetical protein ULMS_17350 [Patiriisocius marinistellae]|uniref:DUF4870 domain-containing protein n=1 Tax=Patiriisocius marinistellae TaxID=2494560 RepID=A0A5J4FUE6_9FLAO|nr:DUF4870 domain-containing protein [Patiriisocius marinistellae]GEQ86227.1 hypothetical protein ULMS_17350 [Patiriisocius marinistellae]